MRHLRLGGKLIGLCGGFQMLGKYIHDPLSIESSTVTTPGLGLIDMETTLTHTKQLRLIQGVLNLPDEPPVKGYEIHMGTSHGSAMQLPAVRMGDETDGAIDTDNQILGTYIHGLFDEPSALRSLLSWSGLKNPEMPDHQSLRDHNINMIADAMEEHIKINALLELLR